MMKLKNYAIIGLKIVGLIVIYYLLAFAQKGAPFGASVLISMVMLNIVPILNILCYVVGTIISNLSMLNVIIVLNVFLSAIITYFLIKKWKKFNKYWCLITLILSLVSCCMFYCGGVKENMTLLIIVILCVILFYISLNYLSAICNKDLMLLNVDEKICGGVLLIVLSMGLNNLSCPYLIVATNIVVILISCYAFSSSATFELSFLLGVGQAIDIMSLEPIAIMVGYGLVATAFKSNYRIISSVAVVLLSVVFGLYFKAYDTYNLFVFLAVAVPSLIYVLVPKKWLNYIKIRFSYKKDSVAVRSLVNRTKVGICKRMNELAKVFDEMNIVFRNMVKGVLSPEEASDVLKDETIMKVCGTCPMKSKCLRNNNVGDVVAELVKCGCERGKVTLLDVPQFMTTKCGKINYLLSTINQSIKSYKNYVSMVENLDNSRILLADQMSGVSELMLRLSDEIRLNVTFDTDKERLIIEELSYVGVVVLEAIVYEDNSHNTSVTLMIKDADINDKFTEAVSNACGRKMAISNTEKALVPSATMVYLNNCANYDLIFGVASVSKNGALKNGDAHNVVKLSNGKYIMSLCDGIGSGEKAQKLSGLTISLIENFYKAGFNNDTILNSINKLLSLNNEESFSSVDLCVMDFHNNYFDFIKLGATYGFIKHSNNTEIIENSGLPIGVLEEMKPHITKKLISPFDMVVLMTDGVTDAFEDKSDLQDFINNLVSTNPQNMADEIMDRAIDLNNGVVKDDMSVIVARVYPI